MVTLEALPTTEIEEFVASSVASFVDDLVESGIDRRAAETAVDAQMTELLPDGVETPGHRFCAVDDAGRTIGRLWFGPLPGSPSDWFLFEIEIAEEERGRGAGREALKVVVDELDSSEVVRLGLHVFESNSAAVALYESVGFVAGNVDESGFEMWLHLATPRGE